MKWAGKRCAVCECQVCCEQKKGSKPAYTGKRRATCCLKEIPFRPRSQFYGSCFVEPFCNRVDNSELKFNLNRVKEIQAKYYEGVQIYKPLKLSFEYYNDTI